MDRGAWRATVHGVTKSQLRLRIHTLSVHLSIHPSLSMYLLFISPSIAYTFIIFICVSVYPPFHPSTYLSIYQSTERPTGNRIIMRLCLYVNVYLMDYNLLKVFSVAVAILSFGISL